MISQMEENEGCIFVTASDTGVNHRVHDVPNQDAVGYAFTDSNYFLAVSDGVGSCSKADYGSKAAVKAVGNVFQKLINTSLEIDLLEIANTIIEEWKNMIADDALDDYCATLKGVIKYGSMLLLFSIGDGLLAVTSNGMKVSSPNDDRLFANQTHCLNSKVNAVDFWSTEFKLDTYVSYVVFACTDGVANGIKDGKEYELVEELEKNINAENLKDELETFILNIAEYSLDDRTIGVIKHEW